MPTETRRQAGGLRQFICRKRIKLTGAPARLAEWGAGMATTWRNEFEIALTALIEASRVKRYGRETIKNTTGWW